MVGLKKKCLLLGGADTEWHQFQEYKDAYSDIITSAGFELTASEDLDLLRASELHDFDTIVCCVSDREISIEQERGLLSAVAGSDQKETGIPKTFVGIHSASATFTNSEKYLRMLGGKFLAHPPISRIKVRKTSRDAAVEGVDDFMINDELYLMEYYPPFKTLLETDYNGFSHPLFWKKAYGLGTVYYLALGHGREQATFPETSRILLNILTHFRIRNPSV